jgi:uncharacterized protein
VSDPSEVLKLSDKVMVKVMEVDVVRKRIALSIKQTEEATANRNSAAVKKFQQPFNNRQSSSNEKNSQRPSEKQDNMQDALALLKSKFRK